jgi:hypothetical protein
MKDGTNVVAITISFQSLSTEISTLTLYSDSYFNITGISIIKAMGDYSLSDLVVLPSDTYEDKTTGSGSIGGFYSSTFKPQIEFFLQENMTSVTAQLEIMFQKDVPSDCEVTYNIYVNDKALYDEEKVFEEGKQQLALTELKAGRNSIRFQILINSYRVKGEGGDQSYTFALKIGEASQLSFSSDSINTGDNNEISKTGIPNVLLFSLVIGLLLFIPSFLFITFKYRRGLVKEINRTPKLSYVDSTDSGRIKTLRIREETY